MFTARDLYESPNALASHYRRFDVSRRLLLTGHSHQAWPDCGFEAQKRAWLDAAAYVDDKWDHAFEQARRVREGFARLLRDSAENIALATNTHDLVVRFLSALPLVERPRLVTTDGEYHTIRRQLDRLVEERVELVKVPSDPPSEVVGRLADAVDERTAAVLVSAVMYRNAHIVRGLRRVMEACTRVGAELLVDAYHALNAIPFTIGENELEGAFVVGGGYKYCQLGEGNCFLRFPADCAMRPVVTGWFSEFDTLADSKADQRVPYGRGALRFAGSTYDPTSHYRAAAVFDFFEANGLEPDFLRRVSRHQVAALTDAFDVLDVAPRVISRRKDVASSDIAGFLALDSPHAATLCRRLRERGVFVDYRGDLLRLGPAPYLDDAQLADAIAILGDVASTIDSRPR